MMTMVKQFCLLCLLFSAIIFVAELSKAKNQNKSVGSLKLRISFPAHDWHEHNMNTFGSYNNISLCDVPVIDILVQFITSKSNDKLKRNFLQFILSLLTQTRCNIKFYTICNKEGKAYAEKIFNMIESQFDWLGVPERIYLDFSSIARKFAGAVKPMQELFSSPANSYYQRSLFFLPPFLHRILPDNISKIIMFDIDLQLRADVKDLFHLFDAMNNKQVMALAKEQQPVYWHITTEFRENYRGTKVGGPPPNGLTGFNSGTKLLRLDTMRKSALYNKYLDNPSKLVKLANKYKFRGHLGDQDFFSLLSFEWKHLFYVLPCQWNRQLCQWWKENGYKDIFDAYFQCAPPHFVLHGNCDTLIL